MTDTKNIVESLSLFNNMSFTKKQWDIVLRGCGCPKSSHFWKALKQTNMTKNSTIYTLFDINNITFNNIWERYCISNRAGVKKSYDKAKAKEKAQESIKSLRGTTFYMIGGVLTTEHPNKEL